MYYLPFSFSMTQSVLLKIVFSQIGVGPGRPLGCRVSGNDGAFMMQTSAKPGSAKELQKCGTWSSQWQRILQKKKKILNPDGDVNQH